MNNPIVSVCCIAFNQENYIKDAIEGFLMQKTDFPIEIIIHDDASTDGTAQIIKHYEQQHSQLIKGIYQKENQFSHGLNHVLKSVYGNAKGKYISLCEGDDYWTDPLKLKKQVDFLESHPECSLCCHKVHVKFEENEEKNYLFPDLSGDHVFSREEMHEKYISATCSVMFRRERIQELVNYLEGFKVGDMPLYFFYLQLGSFGYIDQVMAVYRKNDSSYWDPHYDQYRFPVLFDTFTKIKAKLKIQGSGGLDRQISFYALGLLEEAFKIKNYKSMRNIVLQSFCSYFAVKKKWRRIRLFKYSFIAYFPWLYSIYKKISAFNTLNL